MTRILKRNLQDRRVVDLWLQRRRAQRHDHDVLTFYGWLATFEPALIPSEPGSYQKLRTLLRDHLLGA